jgi:CBS domain-containing protein
MIATEDAMSMNRDFLEQPTVQSAGVLPMRRPTQAAQKLRLNDPALSAMTDFTRQFAITVAADRRIDAALADMARVGVRAMLVVRSGGVIGLITSYDIEGPRAQRFTERASAPREDIRVRDIMTAWQDLHTLDWHTVQTAKILDLLEIFDGIGLMHLLVVETDDHGAEVVRGLISRSRIERGLRELEVVPGLRLTRQ